MPAINKIEAYNLGARVLSLTGQGRSTHEIASTLTKEAAGDYSISQSTVARWLKRVRKERSEETKQIVHDHIRKTVPADLDALDEVEGWLLTQFRSLDQITAESISKALGVEVDQELYDKIREVFPSSPLDVRIKADLAMKIRSIVDTKLKYAGILENPETAGASDADPVNLEDFETEKRTAANG